MATTTAGRRNVKQDESTDAQAVVADQLEALARDGARTMLTAALNDEVALYLGRARYERSDVHRGYRNGSTRRKLTLGAGTIDLAVPRVRDVPDGQAPFESQIVGKYQRRSQTIDATFLNLFVEGLATRDFEPALRLLVGQDAPLSPSTISRLTQQFKAAYEAFDRQDLSQRRFVYLWADGLYLKAGLGTEKACLMVLIGADTAGEKHLIALREGYRESAESWGDLLRDCRRRGLNEPACWIADGALGLWAAIDEHSPKAAQQRCTNHKTMNVVAKLPKSEQPEAIKRLRAIWQADTEQAARKLAERLVGDLQTAGYDRAADCLASDLDRCLTYYRFPEAHWTHLRTTNPIESVFASVRLRTNAARRFKKTRSGVHLMYQVVVRLSKRWRRLTSAHLCSTVPLPKTVEATNNEAA
jgi:transposase-like protein